MIVADILICFGFILLGIAIGRWGEQYRAKQKAASTQTDAEGIALFWKKRVSSLEAIIDGLNSELAILRGGAVQVFDAKTVVQSLNAESIIDWAITHPDSSARAVITPRPSEGELEAVITALSRSDVSWEFIKSRNCIRLLDTNSELCFRKPGE